VAQAKAAPEPVRVEAKAPAPPARPVAAAETPVQVATAAPTMQLPPVPEPAVSVPHAASAPQSVHRDGWIIQVGAFDQETEAKQRLNSAQSRAKTWLVAADPFTERVMKGDKALYRARFAGLDKDKAEAACKYLKKNEIACMALKN
jgi:D-alanyl-D-alanine carboxypeptidase